MDRLHLNLQTGKFHTLQLSIPQPLNKKFRFWSNIIPKHFYKFSN